MIVRRQLQHQLVRVVLWVRPDGGQARSRRNAWAAMVSDRQRRVDWLAVEAATRRSVAARELHA